MVRKRKTGKSSKVQVMVLLVAISLFVGRDLYSKCSRGYDGSASVPAEQGIFGEESSESMKPLVAGASESSTKQSRAKGQEIPAYLTDRDEEIVQHTGFTLSYNKKRLVPNWVAWVLTAERTQGTEKRAENFQPDESIKEGPTAQLADYRRSGYDRGHMCPAADCKHSRASQNECFLLSNMCPQTHTLNAGDWQELEDLCRKWAVAYDSVYVVCGPIVDKGIEYQTIGDNQVMVPEQFYKVVMRWTGESSAEAIGFIFNNDDTSQPLYSYAVSVDSVEARTRINFFSKFPKGVERKAEAQFDCSKWKGLARVR